MLRESTSGPLIPYLLISLESLEDFGKYCPSYYRDLGHAEVFIQDIGNMIQAKLSLVFVLLSYPSILLSVCKSNIHFLSGNLWLLQQQQTKYFEIIFFLISSFYKEQNLIQLLAIVQYYYNTSLLF